MRQLRLWLETFVLCWRRRPGGTALVFLLQVASATALVGSAYGLRLLVDQVAPGGRHSVWPAAVVAAAALTAGFYLGEITDVLTIHLVDRIGLTVFEPEIMGACTGIEGIEHLERPEYLDKVTATVGQGWAIVESAWAALGSLLVVAQLALLLLLLGGTSPWTVLMMPFAVLHLVIDRAGRRALVTAQTESAESMRLQRRLFEILSDPDAGKELRLAGAGPEIARRQREAWDRVVSVQTRARRVAAVYSMAGWTLFAGGYTLVLWLLLRDDRSAGDFVLVVTAAAQLRSVVEAGLGHSSQALEAKRIVEPFLWLRARLSRAQRSESAAGRSEAPQRLVTGLQVEDLGFSYPGSAVPAIEDVTVFLPAGSVVAVVGEYGSGKTTLLKLLSKFYEPTHGSIQVDGNGLGGISAVSWWARMSAAFQDFGRYQASVEDAVLLGSGASRLAEALAEAEATEFVRRLPDGTSTELGNRFGGVDLSEGQWQRIALARASVREEVLLFVLDEPTASLDSPSEHAIFQRYFARARALAQRSGAVTVVVSHRFSTVAEADIVLVMEKGRLVEKGTHAELMERGGIYSEFYNIQASAYAAAEQA